MNTARRSDGDWSGGRSGCGARPRRVNNSSISKHHQNASTEDSKAHPAIEVSKYSVSARPTIITDVAHAIVSDVVDAMPARRLVRVGALVIVAFRVRFAPASRILACRIRLVRRQLLHRRRSHSHRDPFDSEPSSFLGNGKLGNRWRWSDGTISRGAGCGPG